MSQDMTICGLEIKRGTKLRTMLPVPDTMTKIPLTVNTPDGDQRCGRRSHPADYRRYPRR